MENLIRHAFRSTVTVVLALIVLTPWAVADELSFAPPAFPYSGTQAVPIDIKNIHLNLTFDVASSKTKGVAQIHFIALANGFPLFDLVPEIDAAMFDGEAIPSSDIPVISDPDHVTKLRVLKHSVIAGEEYDLELSYTLSNGVTYEAGVLKAGFFMTDLRTGGRGYWEQYGPANFEFDQFQQTIHVKILNSAAEHTVYTNATTVDQIQKNEWNLSFPEYYTTSSFYLHIAAKGRFQEKSTVFHGQKADVPVTAYADDADVAENALAKALKVLGENEKTFGPYAHPKALAYITLGGGGMEYAGATMTSPGALAHEFTHFWMGRGIMPADGNAGWMDEAIASWHDEDYERSDTGPSGSPHNLGGFSVYKRDTTMAAYSQGMDFISQLDKEFESYSNDGKTGMRAILSSLYLERQHTPITVNLFKNYVEKATGSDLSETFAKYVYGKGVKVETDTSHIETPRRHHPRPYTDAELLLYR